MVWGSVSAYGMGNLLICDSIINPQRYMEAKALEQLWNTAALQQTAWLQSTSGKTRLACLQSVPVSHWKCVMHYETPEDIEQMF